MASMAAIDPAVAVELALLTLGLLYPIYAVARLRLAGIPLGAVVFWLALGAAEYVPGMLDRGRGPSGLAIFGVAGGWLFVGTFYGAMIMVARLLLEAYVPRMVRVEGQSPGPDPGLEQIEP